jgi:hypothetical protein
MITKPDATTDDIAKAPRMEEGLVIVGIYMIFMIISVYLTYSHIQFTGSYQGMDASSLSTLLMAGGIIGAIFYSLIGWPITTGAAHILSMFSGGNGKFYPKMLTLIGYCMIPLIFVSLISIILALFTPTTVVNLSSLSSGLQGIASNSTSSTLSILSIIVSLAGAVWAAYMMLYAVKNGESLSINKSAVIILILFIAGFVLTYGSIVLGLLSR